MPRKAAGTAEGLAGTVGSVKASLDHGDVSERVNRPRRRALAEGRDGTKGEFPVAGLSPKLSCEDQSLRD